MAETVGLLYICRGSKQRLTQMRNKHACNKLIKGEKWLVIINKVKKKGKKKMTKPETN